MENLPIKVQAINSNFVFPLSTCWSDSLVSQNLTEGGHVTGRLVAVVITHLPVKDPEEIVVSTTDDLSGTESRK